MSDFTTEAFTLLGVAIGVIFLRTYARVKAVGINHLQADDYLMLFVAVTYSAETALAYSVGAFWRGLANNGMTDEERRNLDPNSEEFMLRVNGSKTQIAGWITYSCLVLWPAKAAMCTFYPAISKINILVTVVLNVITDLYLLSIPIPMLWGAQLPLRKKLGLIVLFSGGIFVTMAGILRCVLIITNPVTGAQQAGSWAVRETFVAIVTTNIPMIFPLVRRWLSPIFGSITSTLSRGTNNRYGNSKRSDLPAPGSIKLDDVTNGSSSGNKKKGRQPFSQYPITEFTLSGSEEHLNKSPPLPGGISKNVEVRVEESKRDVGSSGTGSMESSMERGDSYFTVDVNGDAESDEK
ncbi:hypothetical protein ColLi_03866 [Colletotrichum liriopes]|uniref:Rhodopsin domain-containing protein n=1 Tax=Colletotrichum liriopes TaxID=708192 RepID=A0AA37LR77_9PEZI|nr:hypothetical protein ColLi_03866 [Colletotrichum liriopes]